ncbi:cilia- and flagella-associated protein 36-like isoform X1 [Acanthaster planci]|uniref:Cilia- and flagella-associated protein 36 n=1 Tax=Acanthaster planci TaxID=133434 RepID=A0A8B8A2B7_ACAPL|nr:cilia- and flagella-associated protein 36-like isoform X1 [Acanthaster planci]
MADNAWLVDGVVQYLRSPIWQMPVMGFIDQHCLVFDPEEENKLAYTDIHKKYQQLVEFMLESFVDDIGIKAEDFVKACQGHESQSNASIMTLFEQVEAAQDFEVFKRMMIKHNIELELQALRVMQVRSGMVPDIMQPGKDTTVKYTDATVDTEDERILNEILRKSKEEYDALKKQGNEKEAGIDALMDKALASSREEAERLKKEKEKEEEMLSKVLKESSDDYQRKEAQVNREKTLLDKALKLSISTDSSKSTSSSSGLPPVTQQSQKPSSRPESKASTVSSTSSSKPAPAAPAPAAPAPTAAAKNVSSAQAAADWLSTAKAEAAAEEAGRGSRASVSSSDANELKKREEYLKKQRDLLIEMKRKEREKNFKKETESQSKASSRPKSARAARQATAGEVKVDPATSAEQEKKLKMRLALADRLKKEVINEK